MLKRGINLPADTARSVSIRFGGGLETSTSAVMMAAGGLIAVENYEPALNGGYERTGGYQRHDGRPRPSDAVATLLQASSVFSAAAVGGIAVGGSSGATGTVAYADTTLIALTKVTGTFTDGETLLVDAANVGSVIVEPSISAELGNTTAAACEDIYRADITAVPGSGAILGAAVLDGVLYAMRNNVGGTAQAIYKATTSGWTLVPLLYEVAFTAGATQPAEGATLTQGGVTATVKRVVLESGSFALSSAAGRYIVTLPSGGSFAAGAFAGGAGTCGGAQTAITLAPGGRWNWIPYNFTGASETLRLYGIDSVNRLCEFDGEVLVPINTGIAAGQYTSKIAAFKSHLFVSYGPAVQYSGIGEPYQWTVLAGADQLSVGDEISDIVVVQGAANEAAMLMLSRNSVSVLYGDDTENFQRVSLSSEAGAKPYSVQAMGGLVLALDDQGMRNYTPTQAFGNFNFNTITDHLRDQLTGLTPTACVLDKTKGRYRLFLSDGRYLCGAPGKRWAWTLGRTPVTITATAEGEVDGRPTVYVGDEDGFVHEWGDFRSFDGTEIGFAMRPAYTPCGMPGRRKAFRLFEVDVRAQSSGGIVFLPDFDYGDVSIAQALATIGTVSPAGVFYEAGRWDDGVWDGTYAKTLRFKVSGRAENVSPAIYGTTTTEKPHQIDGVRIKFIPMRTTR